MTDHINPGLVETARPYSTGLSEPRRTPRTCQICDIQFWRTDNAPIPDELCVRCHEELEALKAQRRHQEGQP